MQGGAGSGHGQRHRGKPHKRPHEERRAHFVGPGCFYLFLLSFLNVYFYFYENNAGQLAFF